VLAFDHHDHPTRFQKAIDGIGDLRRQPFLNLGSFGIEIDEAGQFAEPGDLAISARYVTDVSNPGERHEMMLAAAPHLDVFDQNQLIVTQVEDGGQYRLRILPEPAEHFRVRPRHPLRGIAQSVPIGIFTDPDQDLPYCRYNPVMIELSYLGRKVNRVNAAKLAPPVGADLIANLVADLGADISRLVELCHRKSGPL
jgi:hypothetical protein